MDKDTAARIFAEIKLYYDGVDQPKYRNVQFQELQGRYQQLLGLKDLLESDARYSRLVNAMSQILVRLERQEALANTPLNEMWSNLSERGMNKAIPPVYSAKGKDTLVEMTDRWGHACSVSNGSWTARNYRVMDSLGYMFLMKEGNDRLPVDGGPIFYDLADIEVREFQLNGKHRSEHDNDSAYEAPESAPPHYSIGFTDSQFRKYTGLDLSSSEIMSLLLQTSRVEFKLSFPVKLRCSPKESRHRMNHFSRFFELSYQDVRVRKDDIVQERKYRVHFNTLLGELFVNNLKARYNDRIDLKFYTLSDSAQLFYRRLLLHHSYSSTSLNLKTIADAAGLHDGNLTNLLRTIEINILSPLKEQGYIDYKRNGGIKLDDIKYKITRVKLSVTPKEDAGSVKQGSRVGKRRIEGR